MNEMTAYTGNDGLFPAERQRWQMVSLLLIIDVILLVIGLFPGLIEAIVSIFPL